MTAAKKPRRTASPKPLPAAELTVDQLRAARLFASMSVEEQAYMLDFMSAVIQSQPRQVRPTLRLISGGAK